MRPWGIVAAILAGLGILILLVYGGNADAFAGRARDGIGERAAQQLVAMPIGLGPDAAVTIVLERGQQPPDEMRPYAGALLPPETVVHTGHGESTTIGAERATVIDRAAELGLV